MPRRSPAPISHIRRVQSGSATKRRPDYRDTRQLRMSSIRYRGYQIRDFRPEEKPPLRSSERSALRADIVHRRVKLRPPHRGARRY